MTRMNTEKKHQDQERTRQSGGCSPGPCFPGTLPWDETFCVGVDTGTPVDKDYQVPFRFTGTINKLTVKLGPK
jgi:hypothetical protein